MIRVGVFGATGYTGYELVRILMRHPGVELQFATSREHAGSNLHQIHPLAPDLTLIDPEDAPLDEIEVAFLCLPHGASAETAARLLEAGCRVIDLSADFRLRDPETYARWYGGHHPAPQLLEEAVYGLTETARDQLPGARLVANPGCYPTSVLLALRPLVRQQAVDPQIIVDAKSGVSGAGRNPTAATHFVQVADNLTPYKVGRVHRHLPEMEQVLGGWGNGPVKILFTPHLLPVPRGLLSTIYVSLTEEKSPESIAEAYADLYAGERFVSVLPAGEVATLAHAIGTNCCVIGLTPADGALIITSTIDNLLKGASGQAVQNMNVMLGFDEAVGLT